MYFFISSLFLLILLNNNLVSNIYVGTDGKLHKVQGGADTVLPFKQYKAPLWEFNIVDGTGSNSAYEFYNPENDSRYVFILFTGYSDISLSYKLPVKDYSVFKINLLWSNFYSGTCLQGNNSGNSINIPICSYQEGKYVKSISVADDDYVKLVDRCQYIGAKYVLAFKYELT